MIFCAKLWIDYGSHTLQQYSTYTLPNKNISNIFYEKKGKRFSSIQINIPIDKTVK